MDRKCCGEKNLSVSISIAISLKTTSNRKNTRNVIVQNLFKEPRGHNIKGTGSRVHMRNSFL